MADFAARIPVEEQKPTWLHDIDNRPKHPPIEWRVAMRRYWPVALGFFLALGFQALSYETRAGWFERRDWVEPSLTVFWAAGGMCAGLLIARRAWGVAMPGIAFLVVGLAFTWANIARHIYIGHGPDGWLTTFDILAVLCYAAMLICFIGGLIWLETSQPIKVPPPEM
jgi:hypothetical protein